MEAEKKMFCKFCGEELGENGACGCEPSDSKYCEGCGKELSDDNFVEGSLEENVSHIRIRDDGRVEVYDSMEDVPQDFKEEITHSTSGEAEFECECGAVTTHDVDPDDVDPDDDDADDDDADDDDADDDDADDDDADDDDADDDDDAPTGKI